MRFLLLPTSMWQRYGKSPMLEEEADKVVPCLSVGAGGVRKKLWSALTSRKNRGDRRSPSDGDFLKSDRNLSTAPTFVGADLVEPDTAGDGEE